MVGRRVQTAVRGERARKGRVGVVVMKAIVFVLRMWDGGGRRRYSVLEEVWNLQMREDTCMYLWRENIFHTVVCASEKCKLYGRKSMQLNLDTCPIIP